MLLLIFITSEKNIVCIEFYILDRQYTDILILLVRMNVTSKNKNKNITLSLHLCYYLAIKQVQAIPTHTASRQARKPFCVGVREKRNLVTAIPLNGP